MKTPTPLLATAVAAFALAAAGCGGLSYKVQGAPPAVGADATITASLERATGTTRLDVDARHLQPPRRLEPGASHFVVWARGNGDRPWQRLGTLVYDEGRRTGRLQRVTVAERRFDLIVTLEREAAPGSPSRDVVFQQQVAAR